MRSQLKFSNFALSRTGAVKMLSEDHGAISSEFAVALPAVLLVTLPLLSFVALANQQVKLWSIAGVVVRAASHLEPQPEQIAGKLLPGAKAQVEFSGQVVCATVYGVSSVDWFQLGKAKLCTRVGGL